MFDLILFDLDGTLTDPFEGITNSVVYALGRFGISVSDKNALKCFIGPPLYESFMTYYSFGEEAALKAVDYYREYFSQRGIFENYVYDGIEELLKRLTSQNKKLMVATSKPEPFAVRILEHFGLANYFEAIFGATMDSSRVNKSDVIRYALRSCSMQDAQKKLMVGDRMHDILGAKSNGIASCGVLYGYGSLSELTRSGADYVVGSPAEIAAIVEESHHT